MRRSATSDRFRNGKQLARYCGLTPCNRSSGDREADAGLVRQANPELRRVLIEAAWLLAAPGATLAGVGPASAGTGQTEHGGGRGGSGDSLCALAVPRRGTPASRLRTV